MKLNKIAALFVSCVLVLGGVPTAFAQNEVAEPYFNENYNQYVSNISVDTIEITNALKNRIVDDGIKNKSLLVEGNAPVLKKAFDTQITGDFVLSFDIKGGAEKISFQPGVYIDNNTEIYPVAVKDNQVLLSSGKAVGGITPGKYTNFAYKFHYELNVCDVYIDRKMAASNIPVSNIDTFKGAVIKFSKTGGKIYLDNFTAYPSDKLLAASGQRNYNTEEMDYIDFNDYTGSFEYWNTYYMNTTKKSYQYLALVPKDNSIECPRLDYKNKNRESWVKLTKTTSNDCYFDILTWDRHARLGPVAQTYKYFVFSGDFMTETGIQNAQFPMIRDSNTYSSNTDSTVASIKNKSIVLSDGTVIGDVAIPGKWFHYDLAINLVDSTVSVYIDGEERAKDRPIVCSNKSRSIDFLSRVRVSLQSGNFKADLKMENCTFTGYEKPFVYGEDPKTSIYYDDAPVAEYLKDKISFHAYAKNLMVNDVKYDISDCMTYDETNDEIYVKASVLSEKLGWSFDSADAMIGVKDYASKNALYSMTNKNGLIVLSKEEMKFDTDGEYQWFIQKPYNSFKLEHATARAAIDDYVFFDRPSAEQLLEMMKERTDNLTAHPRIYADKNKFDEYRSLYKTDATFKKWADVIIKQADGYANPDTPYIDYVYQDEIRMQSLVHTKYQDRFTALGFAYQMTGDKKYVERAVHEFEMLATFPDMNPSHIIDTGCMNEAVALGYDWMYDGYTEEQRRMIENTVLTHCIKPIASGFYGLFSAYCSGCEGWYAFKVTNNFNTWTIGGLFAATCAFMECDPEYLSDVAEKCIRGLEYSIKGFAPDGAWLEGPDYWQHTTRYLTVYAGTALTCFGSDFNILEYQGVSEAPDWIMSITGLQGVHNFGDAVSGQYTFDEYAFFSHYFGNRAIGSLRKYDIVKRGAVPQIYDILFYDPSVGMDEFENLPKVVATRGRETVGIRESFTDKNGMFFSAVGGAVGGYHAHFDTGAFVFDLNGIRWAHDLGKDNYNTGLPSRQVYRMRSEAHNTISINVSPDKDSQLEKAYAPIVENKSNEHSAYITYDMSEVYAETDSFTRGFYIGDDYRTLTIRDEISLNSPSEVYWTMNTMANVSVYGNEAMLYQGGKALRVRVECDAEDWEFVDLPCKSVVNLPAGAVAQNPNSEYTKLAIRANSSGKFNITVKLAALGEAGDLTPVDLTPISQWKLSEIAAAQTGTSENITANVYADGKLLGIGDQAPIKKAGVMPEITVEPTEDAVSYEYVNIANKADEKTVIKVYNADKSDYRLYVVKYSGVDIALWENYNVLDIADYSVSKEPQLENAAPNMFDGNFSTRWTSLNEGEYVTVDLGSEQNVAAVAMGFWQSEKRSYNYIIQTSTDGVNYTTVTSGASPMKPEGYHIYDFKPTTARYIKVIGNGNTANVNTNILELRVLGSK